MPVIPRAARESTAFLLCDIQERFRAAISHFPSVIHVATTMVHGGTRIVRGDEYASTQIPNCYANRPLRFFLAAL